MVVVVVVIRSMAKEIVRDLLSIFLLLSLIEVFSSSVSNTGLLFPENEEFTFSHIFKGDTTRKMRKTQMTDICLPPESFLSQLELITPN